MWHIKGFVPGLGYITSQYCCYKKEDMESVGKDMEKKEMLFGWQLVFKKEAK